MIRVLKPRSPIALLNLKNTRQMPKIPKVFGPSSRAKIIVQIICTIRMLASAKPTHLIPRIDLIFISDTMLPIINNRVEIAAKPQHYL